MDRFSLDVAAARFCVEKTREKVDTSESAVHTVRDYYEARPGYLSA